MSKKKILFIGGSMNQTTIMHQISEYLDNDYDCYFSYYYADGIIDYAVSKGLVDFAILGKRFQKINEDYFKAHELKFDPQGRQNNYDLVFTCSDLIVPENIRDKKLILVQEGMTDPENLVYHVVKRLKLPRWLASTSTTGLSHMYDRFCVASEGYRDHFIRKGADPDKIIVTGIPNFDNAAQYLDNDFPHKNYVMVATSDSRETFKYENRKKFIEECVKLANGRQLLFKFHPNENHKRATAEVNKYAPGALTYSGGNTNHMIANCDVLVTKYSSVVYIGISLGKEVHSYFNLDELKRMTPLQNGGTSAEKIAIEARKMLGEMVPAEVKKKADYQYKEVVNL